MDLLIFCFLAVILSFTVGAWYVSRG